MDFEQLSGKYKAIKSPDKNSIASSIENKSETGFIETLKIEEAESKRKYYRMYILYTLGAVAYFSIFILNPDSDLNLANRIAGICFVLAFAIIAVLSRKRFSEINSTSFLDSPNQFLLTARKRFSFWNKQQLWLIPVVLLVNMGATLSVSDRFGNLNLLTGILIFQVAFWALIAFGFYMGKRAWTKKKKPILSKINEMLVTFDE